MERGRTVGQLKMFERVLREGSWVRAVIDHGDPTRTPVPKPDVRRMLMTQRSWIDGLRYLVFHNGACLDRAKSLDDAAEVQANRELADLLIPLSKSMGTDVANELTSIAVQIFGGMGFSKDLPIERYYRDARIYRIFDGASEIHRGVIAKSMLKGGTNIYDPWGA